MNFEDCRNNADRDKYGLCAAGLGKCEPDCVFYMRVNKPTNADRIRSMNDEELAKTLADDAVLYEEICGSDERTRVCDNDCVVCALEWLQQPAKEEHNEAD